jgi:hypothetical protein
MTRCIMASALLICASEAECTYSAVHGGVLAMLLQIKETKSTLCHSTAFQFIYR